MASMLYNSQIIYVFQPKTLYCDLQVHRLTFSLAHKTEHFGEGPSSAMVWLISASPHFLSPIQSP